MAIDEQDTATTPARPALRHVQKDQEKWEPMPKTAVNRAAVYVKASAENSPYRSEPRKRLAESLESCSTDDWTWQPGTATDSRVVKTSKGRWRRHRRESSVRPRRRLEAQALRMGPRGIRSRTAKAGGQVDPGTVGEGEAG